jgi:hypothetical protein
MYMLPLLFLAITSLQDPSSTGDRTPVAPTISYGDVPLSPALHSALLEVLQIESEIERMTRTTNLSGEPYTEEQYNEKLFGEGAELGEYLTQRLPRFGYGKQSPHITECFESIRHDAGFQAMQSVLLENPDFKSHELIELFTSGFVTAKPIWGTEEALQYHEQEAGAGRLAPLCNGGALGYLTWGMLYSDSYWKAEEHDREAFLAELIDRGFDSLLVARVVTRSLEEPLLFEDNPGRGIAGSLASLKGKVGFTTTHEQQLMADLEVVQALDGSLEADLNPALDVRRVKLVTDETGITAAKMPRRGHLKVWLPATLMQVRMELYPTGANDKMRRGKTLEERKTYWARTFASLGFVAGRDLALLEIEAMVFSDDSFPQSEELKVLEDKLAAGQISGPERERMQELQTARTKLGDAVITDLVQLIAANGTEHFYELTSSTLAVDLPKLLGGRASTATDDALFYGWLVVSFEHDARAVETVQAGLVGDYNLGKGMGQMIMDLAAHERPGSRDLLEQILKSGTAANRSSAIVDSEWLDADRYQEELSSLFDIAADPAVARTSSARLHSNLFLSLGQRKDRAGVKRFLQGTFDQGIWKTPKGTGAWGDLSQQRVEFVMEQFSRGELEDLVSLGLMHPGYLPDLDD